MFFISRPLKIHDYVISVHVYWKQRLQSLNPPLPVVKRLLNERTCITHIRWSFLQGHLNPILSCKLLANWRSWFIYSPKAVFLLTLALASVNVGPCEHWGLSRFDCEPKMMKMIPNVCYYCTKETRWYVCVGSRLIFGIGNNSQSHVWNRTPKTQNQTVKLHPNAFGSEFTLYDEHMAGVEEYDLFHTALTPVVPVDPLVQPFHRSQKLVLDWIFSFVRRNKKRRWPDSQLFSKLYVSAFGFWSLSLLSCCLCDITIF